MPEKPERTPPGDAHQRSVSHVRALFERSVDLKREVSEQHAETVVQMVHALGRPGDVLVGISTSGRSMSVVRALRVARQKQMLTIGLLGGEGQPALAECDLAMLVPSSETGRVQECHITAGHAMIELVEALCCNYSI